MRIALVHDYLVQYGGAERVLECFSELFPRAPIYTLVYNKKILGKIFAQEKIRTSFLQKVPFSQKGHHLFPALMPAAIEQFDLSGFDIVLSDSSSFGKGIITGPNTLHICYCHTPMRYAWDDCHRYAREFYYPSILKKLIPFGMNYIRIWDKMAAKRVDYFIANSRLVKTRIKKYYGVDAKVINPPVHFKKFQLKEEKTGEYFLMVGRLVPYKRFDLGIKAFNKLGQRLKVVGGGPEFKHLKKIAGPNVEMVGEIKSYSSKLVELYQNSKAVIYPQEEDFGLVPLEAMACGKPVIAYKRGGALETVKDPQTGVFFDNQTVFSLIKAVRKFEKLDFDCVKIREHADRFNKERFKREILNYVQLAVEEKIKINVS